ncbi:MAG: 3-ketoacyl-CoA thiolase [Lentimicrobiaceae bacterium]|jgi:acetyl-CoA C-acetyltransferase/acetyl-CoA acyltransferase|nr:3-ketoacyl-CoA thiolase [Lentimicrobiaceae bacterium]MCP4910254.1 3-ketoacyl-CoA thiolase [Bacteroidota bacterium]MBT3455421.1 3-ketoacyl-CoA thiolase [Lentimicrobiaceae bacterium]MBT3818742.1 3-ketoacyl-CoA thiolase [Lentimicrobiaceae bacterium]MBT4062332.1 3-ketoacyl-CoA thiolase [Lentimicrobiaceae bacterium]
MKRKVYMTGGFNTISMGTGRKEFHPKKPRPGLEDYIRKAGKGTLDQIGGADNVDEGVIGNFMASRFNKQANLPGFVPYIDEKLQWKPATSVEGACASGGLALISGIKSVLAETADVVLSLGVEVQNTVKAMYCADILAGAGWYQNRKNGHAYFFPGQNSDRAGAYYEKVGYDKARSGMKQWFINAMENARLDETAQEHQNKVADLGALYDKLKPNGTAFVDHLNVLDCSKVSDGASAIAICSEEGLERTGVDKKDAIEVMGFAQSIRNITNAPTDLTELETIKKASQRALENAGITIDQVGTIETHDCFSIAGVLSTEAIGLAKDGEGWDYVASGNTARDGKMPMNTTGGLIGWGHPTGATGVHQAVTIWQQLTGKAGKSQIKITDDRPYGMTINMGGDDVTVVAIVYKRA